MQFEYLIHATLRFSSLFIKHWTQVMKQDFIFYLSKRAITYKTEPCM